MICIRFPSIDGGVLQFRRSIVILFKEMGSSELYPRLQIPYSSKSVQAEDGSSALDFLKKSVRLFHVLPHPILQEISRDIIPVRYARGQYVCHTGDPATSIWIVREGTIRVHQHGWKGNNLSIEIMIPGDVSGLAAAVCCETYPGDVVATQDTVIYVLPKEILVNLINRHPIVAKEILFAIGQRLHFIETMLYLSREPVEKRLVAALVYLYHKFGVSIPLTRQEIGEMAGTTPETTMRFLKKFEKRGYLKGYRGKVCIQNPDFLIAHLKNPNLDNK